MAVGKKKVSALRSSNKLYVLSFLQSHIFFPLPCPLRGSVAYLFLIITHFCSAVYSMLLSFSIISVFHFIITSHRVKRLWCWRRRERQEKLNIESFRNTIRVIQWQSLCETYNTLCLYLCCSLDLCVPQRAAVISTHCVTLTKDSRV